VRKAANQEANGVWPWLNAANPRWVLVACPAMPSKNPRNIRQLGKSRVSKDRKGRLGASPNTRSVLGNGDGPGIPLELDKRETYLKSRILKNKVGKYR